MTWNYMKTKPLLLKITFRFNKIEVNRNSEMPNYDLQAATVQPLENTNPTTNDINFNMTFSKGESRTAIMTEDEDSKMYVFQHFAARLRKKCLTMQEFFITRTLTVEDALGYYKYKT